MEVCCFPFDMFVTCLFNVQKYKILSIFLIPLYSFFLYFWENTTTMFLNNFPVLKILIPFILGIFGGYYTHFDPKLAFYLFFFQFFLFFLAIFNRKKTSFLGQKTVFFSLICFFFLAGYLFTTFHYSFFSSRISSIHQERKKINVEIIEPVFERAKSVKTIVQNNGQKILLYIQKDSMALQLKPGDIIRIDLLLKTIDPPQNPASFNYREYMKRKKIIYTAYVSTDQWLWVDYNRSFNIKYWAYQVQQKLSQIFVQYGLSGKEYQVAAAILLGNDDTMEPELKSTYSNAGVSHILSVSGMHVGIIFMILNHLLIPLGWNKKTRYLKTGILFLSVWLYATITGLSPSVIRSASMFTFVLTGAMLHRKTNIYQSLYASLFILLLINPLLIFDVGFQLSYLAVFGIVFFQKPIESLYQPKTKMGNYVWSLCSVSIAAQLATFPISIFYFHQFPNYFLLANLMVIFLSFCIMVCGIAVLAVSFIPLICTLLAKLLQLLISWMNHIIEFIQQLPGAVTENLSISITQMLMLYLCIILTFIALRNKNKRALQTALLTLLMFWISYTIDIQQSRKKTESIIFATSKTPALLFRDQGFGIILSDSITDHTHPLYRFSIQNYMIKEKINPHFLNLNQDTIIGDFYKKGDMVLFRNKKILLVKDQNWKRYECLKVDYIFLMNKNIDLTDLVQRVSFRQLIWDEQIPVYQEERWLDYCEKNNINYYSVRKNGFLKIPYH